MTDLSHLKRIVRHWLPPLAGIGLIVAFLSLAAWQLERAAEKEATAALFAEAAAAEPFDAERKYALYEQVTARGRYLPDRQLLIDNIVKNARLGYYVITPLQLAAGGPLLLVNRGWLPKPAGNALPDIAVAADARQVAGRIGRLPRVALRPDYAIEAGQDWPRLAVYPQLEDVAATLGQPLAGAVLLLAEDLPDGFVRDWQPQQRGPLMHYGYAFQWSALAVTVLVVLVWQLRKRYRQSRHA